MRTHTKEPLEYKTRHNPTISSTLSRMPHLNNKQSKNTNPVISRQDYYFTQPCPSEEKHINKQKLSTNLNLYEAYTNHWTNLRGQKPKGRKNSTLKGDLKHNKLKNNSKKAEEYCAN